MAKFDYGVTGDSFEKLGPSWMYDAHGFLCRPVAVRGDTDTGVCECAVYDDDGTRVIDYCTGEAIMVTRNFAPPLTLVPVPPGCDPKKPPLGMGEYRDLVASLPDTPTIVEVTP